MTARPMTERERAEADEAAQRVIVFDATNCRENEWNGILAADAKLLAHALLSTSSEVRRLREALEKAGEQFRFYEREHQAKADAVYAVSGPRRDEYEKRASKAKTNKDFADMCFAALSVEGEDELARGQGRSAPISTDTKDTTK